MWFAYQITKSSGSSLAAGDSLFTAHSGSRVEAKRRGPAEIPVVRRSARPTFGHCNRSWHQRIQGYHRVHFGAEARVKVLNSPLHFLLSSRDAQHHRAPFIPPAAGRRVPALCSKNGRKRMLFRQRRPPNLDTQSQTIPSTPVSTQRNESPKLLLDLSLAGRQSRLARGPQQRLVVVSNDNPSHRELVARHHDPIFFLSIHEPFESESVHLREPL